MRLELLGDSQWELTVPLVHRLRHDAEAVDALRSSLGKEAAAQGSPLFAPGWTPDRVLSAAAGLRPEAEAEALEGAARRAFVSAVVLRRAGHLEAADVAACVHAVQRVDPRTPVVDPFTHQAGPLWSAGVGLVGAV